MPCIHHREPWFPTSLLCQNPPKLHNVISHTLLLLLQTEQISCCRRHSLQHWAHFLIKDTSELIGKLSTTQILAVVENGLSPSESPSSEEVNKVRTL